MRTAFLAAAALLPSVAHARPHRRPQPADAGGGTGPVAKSPPACGAKIMPLAEGDEWTYEPVIPPAPVADAYKRLVPRQPKQIVVTVAKIDAQKGADTVITLQEKVTYDLTKDGDKTPKLDERTLTTTITCNDKNKFDLSPESFWFSGEPGGYNGFKIDGVEHAKGTSLQLTKKGGIGEAEWGDDLKLTWAGVPTEGSKAKLASGRLELERRITPQQPETVSTKFGSYKAEKLGIITTGRVYLDGAAPDAKPMELPAGWLNTIWMAQGVGVVQTLNTYAQMYQLVDAKLK